MTYPVDAAALILFELGNMNSVLLCVMKQYNFLLHSIALASSPAEMRILNKTAFAERKPHVSPLGNKLIPMAIEVLLLVKKKKEKMTSLSS